MQATQGALTGNASYLFHSLQVIRGAGSAIPIIPLHAVVCLGNHRATDAVPRTGVAAGKTVAIAVSKIAFAG